MKRVALSLCFAVAAVSLSGCACCPCGRLGSRPARFDFALIGDVPYSVAHATNDFPNMIAEINRARLAFVVHDGDLKASATPCTEEIFQERYQQFQTFQHPLIYLFGDNEWTDCGSKSKGESYDPEERLAKLREIFCPGNESLGQRKLILKRQSDDPRFAVFRENVRWLQGDVLFVGLNVPGDKNNYGQPEYAGRNAANLAWMKESFALATTDKRRGLMLIMQANPRFDLVATNKALPGFKDFFKLLEEETIAFKKPVVLVHGDSHYFRMDKPLIGSRSRRRIENFTRVETFGNPDVHWVRATVDARDPNVFSFQQQIVRKNLVEHSR